MLVALNDDFHVGIEGLFPGITTEVFGPHWLVTLRPTRLTQTNSQRYFGAALGRLIHLPVK